ncbi:MAG: hypothetical protein ACK5DG_13925 [Chitinophagaceae bacterium]
MSKGCVESLLNFRTMVSRLTALAFANASLFEDTNIR